MPIGAHFLRLASALGFSAAVLIVAIAIQAAALFQRPIAELSAPPETHVRRVALLDEGREAVVSYAEFPKLSHLSPRYVAAIIPAHSATDLTARIQPMPQPWIVAAAASAPYAFLSTKSGELFAVNSGGWSTHSFLGQLARNHPGFLEASYDGALVIAGDRSFLSAWDRAAGQRLWQRLDVCATGGAFVPGTRRFFCCTLSDQILELDPQTGHTRVERQCPCDSPLGIDVDSQACRMVLFDPEPKCVVLDLAAGNILWSSHQSGAGAQARFSPDGQCVVTPCARRPERLIVLSAATGDLVKELCGASGGIRGLTVSPQGLVYAWDSTATITVWDLVSGMRLHQFRPPCLTRGS